MITELKILPMTVTPGHKIEVAEYAIRNYRMHGTLEALSRLTLFMLECDSNNTVTKVTPRNARQILTQWDLIKDEFAFGMTHNDSPTGAYELAYKILFLHQTQIQRIRNVKMKRVVAELYNLFYVIMSMDSSHTQQYIAADDADTVRETFRVVDDVMRRWLGIGQEGNLGTRAPAFEILGDIVPNETLSYAEVIEPSPVRPSPFIPDVPDIDQANNESLKVGGTPNSNSQTGFFQNSYR